MFDELPRGWVRASLGEIAKPSRRRALPEDGSDMRYVGLEHIQPQTMKLLGHSLAREALSSAQEFFAGDVLYGRMRPYLNKVWVAEFAGACSLEFLVFPRSEELNSTFLAMCLNGNDFVTFANRYASGERPRVDFTALARFPILLPPLAEQERIAAKVSSTLAGVDRAKAITYRARERLQRYRAAVLQSAATGDLTSSWREAQRKSRKASQETAGALLQRLLATRRALWQESELERLHEAGKQVDNEERPPYDEPASPDSVDLPAIPPNWTWARLQQLGFVTGGVTKNPYRSILRLRVPYLRVGNVYANELRLDNVSKIGLEQSELDRFLLKKGDLLVVEGNGSRDQIGRLAIWDGSIQPCVHQNHIIKVRLVEKELGKWILSWLLSPPGRDRIEKVASSTTGLYTLSVTKVGNLPIALPPVAEQAEINREVDRRLTAADRLAETLDRQLERAEATRQSLLHEACAGRLIPQNPNDEPASLLLERIRAAHKAEALKPKAKPMPKKRSAVARRPLLAVLSERKRWMTPEQLFIDAGFKPSQVDLFYRELATLRDRLLVEKPPRSQAKPWPDRASVLVRLKEQ